MVLPAGLGLKGRRERTEITLLVAGVKRRAAGRLPLCSVLSPSYQATVSGELSAASSISPPGHP